MEDISVASSVQPLQLSRTFQFDSKTKGGIRIFGCKSRLASDDFVLPAWIVFLSRLMFLTATLAIMVYSMQIVKTGPSCLKLHNLDIYMPVMLALMSANGILNLLLALQSARGVIWDPNPNARHWVSPLVHTSFMLGIIEIILVINGTIWISNALASDCAKTDAEQVSMYVILGLIVFKWLGISVTIIIVVISLKDLWPVCCCRSRSNGQRSGQLSSTILDHVTDPGECFFNIFKRCCVASKQVDYFNDIADLINDAFGDQEFVPTDIAAALILLSEKNQQIEIQPKSMKNKEIHLRHLEEYVGYAFAIYGWPMYLLDNDSRLKHCWNLVTNLSPCSCCCCFGTYKDYAQADNCCLGHSAALKLKVPHINDDDIIHLSLKNGFLETPFLVVADQKLAKIVIAIRGTLSLADIMTDMVAKPVSLKSVLEERMSQLNFTVQEEGEIDKMSPAIQVHMGMAQAALYVLNEINENHLLEKASVEFPDFPLVITGHSLGAGTAAILAFILKLKYPSVKCFAFGPPGGLLSHEASIMSSQFITSVVAGDDLIPRLSFNGYLNLRTKMKRALRACKLPKHKVLATGLCNCLSPLTWKQRLREDPSITDEIIDESETLNYGSTLDVERGVEDSQESCWPEMLPPGKIVHIFQQKSDDDENQVSMCLRDPRELGEILVSSTMINDHTPSSYLKLICKAKARFIRNQSHDDSNPSV